MEYQDDKDRIPFYLTYPLQNMYLMEMEYEKDMDRMKTLYPREVRELLPYVEKRCDELEYEGSRIYDEEPDRQMLEEETERIYQAVLEGMNEQTSQEGAKEQSGMGNFSAVTQMQVSGLETAEDSALSGCGEPVSEETMESGRKHRSFVFAVPEEYMADADDMAQDAGKNVELAGMNWNRGHGGPPPRPQGPGGPPPRPQGPGGPPPRPQGPGGNCNGWLCSMIGILFRDELYRRRCRNRRCQRWW